MCPACDMRRGARSADAASEPGGRVIRITDTVLAEGGSDTIRLGKMHSGEMLRLPCRLENGSREVVVIISCDRSCGCTDLEYEHRPLRPGEVQRASITFDSRGEWGWQLKTLDIRFSGHPHPLRLWIEAEVE